MSTFANRKTNRRRSKSFVYEKLEDKHLLTTIVWDNPNLATNGFNAEYGSNAATAAAIVNHAIDTWEGYISDFNYQNVGTTGNAPVANTYNITISAEDMASENPNRLGVNQDIFIDGQNKPYKSTIRLDDNAAGSGWYFDSNVLSDTEFTQIQTAFSADVHSSTGLSNNYDLYTTVLHELGHAMGFFTHITSPPNELMNDTLTPGNRRLVSDNTLTVLTDPAFFGYDYTLSSQVATDNLYVHVNGSDLLVRGLQGNQADAITIFLSNSNDMVVIQNGFTERVPISSFSNVDIRTWQGNDSVILSSNVQALTGMDFYVDLFAGTDTLVYTDRFGSVDEFIVGGDKIQRQYRLTGPTAYGDVQFKDTETVRLFGGNETFGDLFTIATTDADVVQVFAGGADDTVNAVGANTRVQLYGQDGNDRLYGGNMNDYINGGDGGDIIRGYSGNDNLQGGNGSDSIVGYSGNDYIRGGAGNDFLNGASGNDRVYGDAGVDTFLFSGSNSTDYITGYVGGDGAVNLRRNAGSFTGSLVLVDRFFADSEDFVRVRGNGGDDFFNINTAIGGITDGLIDGGTGFDTVSAIPTIWAEVNTEA